MSAEKIRFPLADARAVAADLCRQLEPHCERIEVAGSIRRQKPTVGDIELLFIPKFGSRVVAPELFPRHCDLGALAIEELLRAKVLAKRPNKLGGTAWGDKNRLAVHVGTGIPVDLFTATTANWFNYLVCRTGGAENNRQIAMAAQARGWKWNPYGTGFERVGFYERQTVKAERDVFDFVGLPYREPEQRQ
jgi:DNA polymerase/3'-5' exonuclease PolX